MNIQKYANLYIGLLFMAFAVVFAVQLPQVRITPVGFVNSRVYPQALIVLLVILSAVQVVLSIQELKRGTGAGAVSGEKKDYRCVLITLLLSIVYVMLLEPLGFLISSAIYIFTQTINLCPWEKVNFTKFGIIAVISSTIIYSFFRYGLNLMLPTGLLTGIF